MSANKTKKKTTMIRYGGVSFKVAERKAINKILDRNWWGIAEETELFESELAKYVGVNHAIFVNSGSSALLVAFAALRLPKGSEVIVPAVTFPTPISALHYLGLTPVVVDVEMETFNIDPEKIKTAITKNTKAIFVVHVAGNPANMKQVMQIARKNNLAVVEDNCDGFGGKFEGKILGSYGTIATISTHAAHMIATGEGGVAFTDDPQLADRMQAFRNWGRLNHLDGRNHGKYPQLPDDYSRRYIYDELGFNLKPLELQAAMGRVQLRRIKEFKDKRYRNYQKILKIFSKYKDFFDLSVTHEYADPCWYTFAFLVKNHSREKFTDFLTAKKIEWRNILAGNIAKQPAYQPIVKVPFPLLNADQVLARGLWISVHPILTNEMIDYIKSSLDEYFSKIGTKH
jgi:CDP-6-deoxy-D-xylo-4-hexulose-3-dehydrase